MNMKKASNYLVYAMSIIAIVFSASSFVKVYANKTPLTSVSSSVAPGQPVDLTFAAEKALPSVVTIKVVQNSKTQTIEVQSDPFSDFFSDPFGWFGNPNQGGKQKRQVQTPKRQGSGSGVIISSDGYIITNNHVVADVDDITVILTDNREFSAKIIGTDPTSDLALIKVNSNNLHAITISDSEKLRVGEWVLAIGNPFSLGTTVTAGIVSAKARGMGMNGVESFIQTDAAINRGNSGGALVNANGELVGINAALYSETGSYSGYGFAIPTTIMKKVVADIKEYGTVQRAMLGISGMDLKNYIDTQKSQDSKKDLDFGTNDGVYVAEVADDGSVADVLKTNDVIVSVGGKNVTKMSELQEALAKYRPGDKVNIGFIRDKKQRDAVITLKNSNGTTKVVTVTNMAVLGADFKPLTDKQKETLNLTYGLQVKELRSGRLKEAGMQEGFIILKANNQNIKTEEDLEKAFKAASNSPEQTLWIWGKNPSGRQQSFAVYLGDDE